MIFEAYRQTICCIYFLRSEYVKGVFKNENFNVQIMRNGAIFAVNYKLCM